MSVQAPSELESLHRELILDHTKAPRNFREIPNSTARAQGHNPSCGDRLTLWVKTEGDLIQDISFKGSGCSISTSSASMMTEAIKGKTIAEAIALFEKFHEALTAPLEDEPDADALGKLAAFQGVRRFPIRVKCATLPWHTLKAALNNATVPVSTEVCGRASTPQQS